MREHSLRPRTLIADYSRKHGTAQLTGAASMRSRAILNTLIVAGGYLLSRLLGLLRDVIISAQFGTSPALDAYRAAFTIPDLIYLVVAGGALGSAFIPVFSARLAGGHEEGAWRLASGVLNLALAGLVVSSALVALLAEPLVALTVGRGFDAEQQRLAAGLMRLLLIQPVLLGLGGLAKATLESFDRFTLPAVGSNLYNLGIIAGALALAPWLGIHGLVWGVNIGAALFLLVQLPGLRAAGARYLRSTEDMTAHARQRWPLPRDPGVAQVLRLLGPRIVGQSAWQINFIAMASFASMLGAGAVAANTYAFQLMVLPHGLIALSLGTVLFPQLARSYGAGDIAGVRRIALSGLRNVLFLALPASVLLATLALPILRLLFQRGAFDAESAALTAAALGAYAVGLWAFAAAEIPVRAFYAMQDTRTPVVVALGAVALNVALGWTFVRLGLGVRGLGLAFSAANIVEAVALVVLLQRRVGGLSAPFVRALTAMALAALGFGVALAAALWLSREMLPFLRPGDAYRWPQDFAPLALWLAGATLLAGSVYAGIAALFRLEELRALLGRLSGLAGRLRR
jgi:putative peptidoglycan lipid II flippase